MTHVDIPRRRVGKTLGETLAGQNPPHVSIQGNKFTLVDSANQKKPVETYDPKTGSYLDCVIIDALEVKSKIFWGPNRQFDPTNVKPPICFSNNGIAPSANAQVPQSRTCHECKWSEWGTATSFKGKGIPACSDNQNIALLVLDADMSFLLRIPPNSLKALNNYNGSFRSQTFEVDDVVTRIDFEAGELGKLRFRPISRLTEADIEKRTEVLNSGVTDALVGRGDRPYQGPIGVGQQETTDALSHYPRGKEPETPQHMFEPEAPQAKPEQKRGPGRPKRIESAPAEQASQGNGQQTPQFGIQEPSQPDPGVQKAVSDFFGQK